VLLEGQTVNCWLAAEEIVTLPPAAVNTAACVSVWPTITLPKFSVAGEMLSTAPALEAPVPCKGRFKAGPDTNTFPPVNPTVVGVNLTFSVTLFPAPRLNGKEAHSPRTHSPAFEFRSESVHGNVCWSERSGGLCWSQSPFVQMTDLRAMLSLVSLATPEPANHNCTVGFVALPVNVTFPPVQPVHPVAVGVNTTFNPTLCPPPETPAVSARKL